MSIPNRPFRVLVAKDVAIGGATSPAALANGVVAIFKDDVTLLGAGEDITDSPSIFMAQGTSVAGDPILSAHVKGLGIRSVKAEPYAAPVAQISHIGNNGANANAIVLVNEGEYFCTIVDKSDKEIGSQYYRFNFKADASATQQEVANGIRDAINANASVPVTAATVNNGANYGIRLTGDAGVYFEAGVDSAFIGTPVTNDTAFSAGSGTSAQVKAMEDISKGYMGYFNRYTLPVSSPFHTVDGATYDLIVIEHDGDIISNVDSGRYNPPMTTIVAIPDGAANYATFLTRLNAYSASCPSQFPAVTL